MGRSTNKEIICENLILCEGRDAEEFLIRYLNSEDLSERPEFSSDFQVMDFGGTYELTNYLTILQNMDRYDSVQSLLIIRDSERNAEKAIDEIKHSLDCCKLEVPETPYSWRGKSPKVGYLLFPTCDSNVLPGTLEDLCLSILSEDKGPDILEDILRFMNDLEKKYDRVFQREFKTKLHTYFSVTDKYVSLKIGEAARAGAFNWSSEKLTPLKRFLLELMEK